MPVWRPPVEALLAQWLERAAVNRKVTGSIPVGSVFPVSCRRPALWHSPRHSSRNWVYSSAVERLTADQQVPGSNPGAPFSFCGKRTAIGPHRDNCIPRTIFAIALTRGIRQCVREVKELDLKSKGLCPHGFEPHRCRFSQQLAQCEMVFLQLTRFGSPCAVGDLAQMVERSLSMREALGSMPRFSIFRPGSFFDCRGAIKRKGIS